MDKKYNFLDGAWDQISGGRQVGTTPTDHNEMYQEYVAREEGWVYVFVSNENPTLVEVYFDDVTVTITPGNVIQGNEYYPYGLQTATSWTRESNVANNFLYNGGTELNQTTQVYDLYYRNYDPVLGRFGQVDPMASQFASLNPYNYGFNDPVSFNDPLGDCPTCGCEVCDAPDLFPHGLPTRKYEGGSLTPFEQFAQSSFSTSYEAAQGGGLSKSGGNYGMLRGQAFNERISNGVAAKADAYRAAYSNGRELDYNKNGEWGWWEDGGDGLEYSINESGEMVITRKPIVTSKFHRLGSGSGRNRLSASLFAAETSMFIFDAHADFQRAANEVAKRSRGFYWNTGSIRASNSTLKTIKIGARALSKVFFYAGAAVSIVNVIENPTGENFAWAAADISVGAVGLFSGTIATGLATIGLAVPGLNVILAGGALVYSGYRLYQAYNDD